MAQINKIINILKKYWDLIVVLVLASILRFQNLGYSDYQGDEIKALFIPEPGQSTLDFLLTQRKGPIQFVITYFIEIFNQNYTNQFISRFLFALAGVLSVWFIYLFVSKLFSRRIAFFTAFFVATNGFFVAFSRIVQYQSFVILFMILSLYFFNLATYKQSYKKLGIYLGFVFWALSILSHYDGVFIFPFVMYLICLWFKNEILKGSSLKKYISNVQIKPLAPLLFSGIIFVGLLALFYIPFVLHLDAATLSYWGGRLEGTGGKISSSILLFSVYQPIYVKHIYTLLFLIGFVGIIISIFNLNWIKALIKNKNIKVQFKTILLNQYVYKLGALLLWFFVPFIFLEVFVQIPGTHIYTYILPAIIVMSIGVEFIYNFLHKYLKTIGDIIAPIGIFIIFSFIFLQSYFVFVDHTVEYPWKNEKFFVWEFNTPSPVFHLSMFGFPYYRDWEGISDFVNNEIPTLPCPKNSENCLTGNIDKISYYSTNERKSISRYHIPFDKDTDSAGFYIHIRHPQSFTDEILSKKASYWAQNYDPVFVTWPIGMNDSCPSTVSSQRKTCKRQYPVANVYYMPAGSLDEIKEMGY